jgi:hypothetical protein|tara:strand:- start:5745 stop:6863 length:1119 start_codon:yes stop_codon:yes gene_type:complete
MLWPISKVNGSSLNWLDEVHKEFYVQMFAGNCFTNCFSNEFIDVLIDSINTDVYFTAVYDLYKKLSIEEQIRYRSIFEQQINFIALFNDMTRSIIQANTPNLKKILVASRKLGGYLYSTTLDLQCFKAAMTKKFGARLRLSNMNEHFQSFKAINGNVCCFCGLENMIAETLVEAEPGSPVEEKPQHRASYDHFLPKKDYPFLAVNFDNLIPCCSTCNEKFKKAKDPLIENEIRQLAFKPFSNEVVNLEVNYENVDGDFKKIRVSIPNTNCDIEYKSQSWNRIFETIDRANHTLEHNFKEEWISYLLSSHNNLHGAKAKLKEVGVSLSGRVKQSREAYFKSLCYLYLSNMDDKTMTPLLRAVSDSFAQRIGKI